MAAVTEARVRELIEERFTTHERQLRQLMNTADFSVRQIQSEAAETRAGLVDSNDRAKAIYLEVQEAIAEFETVKYQLDLPSKAIDDLMSKAQAMIDDHLKLKADLDKAFVEAFSKVELAANKQEHQTLKAQQDLQELVGHAKANFEEHEQRINRSAEMANERSGEGKLVSRRSCPAAGTQTSSR